MMVDCNICHGAGRNSEDEKCDWCNGRGRVHSHELNNEFDIIKRAIDRTSALVDESLDEPPLTVSILPNGNLEVVNRSQNCEWVTIIFEFCHKKKELIRITTET